MQLRSLVGAGDNLYSINPATAVATLIGPLGVTEENGGLALVRK